MNAHRFSCFMLGLGCVLHFQPVSTAATTINTTNKFAYGANIGWMDWRGDTNNGAVIGEFVCSGYIWSANVGWIHLGSDAPVNGIQYQNNSASDYGVNHDGQGNLRGYAWAANIGWINFESNGVPRVDLVTGNLSGSVYSANCGWISLSNAFARVQSTTIQPGVDTDSDNIADAWERQKFGNLTTATATSDFDADGSSDRNEYLADTNPNDAASNLRILTNAVVFFGANDSDTLTWTTQPTRQYRLQYRTALDTNLSWVTLGFVFGPAAGATRTETLGFGSSSPQRFFRVEAVKPLSP